MKAVQIDEYGGPEVLRYRENVQEPEVAANKLLIDIHAATVNPVDWKIMSGGRQKQMPLTMPFVLGVDLSGVVREVGEGITEFAPGDPVWAVVNQDQPGGYQEVNAVDAGVVSLKPKNVSHVEAAALALTGLTAMVAIDDTAGLKPGEKILVQGGAGGVGSFAVQAAKAMGAEVFATCSERNIDYVRSLGVDHVIDYTKGDFRDAVPIVDVVFDTVGNAAPGVHEASFDVLAPGGRLVWIAGQPESFSPPRDDVEVLRPQVYRSSERMRRVANLVEAGSVKPPEIKEISLADIPDAHRKSMGYHVRGKMVVRMR